MIPNTAPIIQLITPACDIAVARAVHRSDVGRWHKSRGIDPAQCPLCAEDAQDELLQAIDDKADEIAGDELQPWQRKLATEVLAAKTAELDAVVDEAEVSPALQAYLDEHELVADRPARTEADQYEAMTAKQLRAVASAAGMKGARVAKKAEMIEYLTHQGCGCTGE